MNYEAPELFELGAAEELTLGRAALPIDDACDCTKCGAAEEEIA